MPLVSGLDLLQEARTHRYAVGAFNANNLEYIQAIVSAAESERAPVIVQASPGAIKYAGLDNIVAMVTSVAARTRIPVVLHLDHAEDVDLVRYCISRGFTSVMIDGSRLSFADNVRHTRNVARMAHRAGVSCEGELGVVPGAGEDWDQERVEREMTDPARASEFATSTGVDSLAVAVGSVHQLTRGQSRLDIERTEAIAVSTGLPLVLHGSSGVNPDDVRAAIAAGVCKVNIATALHQAFTGALHRAIASRPDEIDPRRILGPAREAVEGLVAERIRWLGSDGRAFTSAPAAGGERQ